MRKSFILLQLFMMITAVSVFANGPEANASLFDLDESQLESDFQDLDQLENYLLDNEMQSLTDLRESQAGMLNQLNLGNLSEETLVAPAFSIDDMDWISFAWGFLCCPIGFFVVGINQNKSSDEKTSFWLGVIGNVIWSGIASALYYRSVL
ncbi:MAG: hypothetical protein AAF587_01165 [Bacteroidota bacterium]